MNKSRPQSNPYERLYGKPLAPEKVAEIKFNFKNYIELLIQMDRQYQEYLKTKDLTENDNQR